MRAIFALFLGLVLAATSVSAAVMHSEMQGAYDMTICADASDSGQTTIRLDATGKPITQHHRCPDCIASLATALLPKAVALLAPARIPQGHYVTAASISPSRPSPQATARGPPPFA